MIAHRGFWNKEYPENSLAAFKNAIEYGYAIELDVQAVEDGTPVVFHDSKMSRMTEKDKYIQNITKEELKSIKLLESDEKIPTLEEVLKLVNGKTPLLVEIKNNDKVGELEKRVLDLLKNYKGEYAIQSFNPYTLKWFYEHAPKIWRGQLSSYFKGVKLSFIKKAILKRLGMKKYTHQDFVSYDINNLPNRFTKKLEVPLLTWTVKKQEEYIKAIQCSDNVIFEGFEPKI
ncbi:MAG TPA: glycerophosphodiester phosphodiesterase [Clostridiales bacterium]|nr:glycerophosphodiester phosphodiesterase [Clostridiales bacterium]